MFTSQRHSFLLMLCGLLLSFAIAQTKSSENASGHIKTIEKSLSKTEKLLTKAKEQNNVSQVNCLLQKRNLILGLLRASQRAKEGMSLASINQEDGTVKSYSDKISAYQKSASEVEQSLDECVSSLDKKEADLATLVYIRTDSEPDFGIKYDDSAWNLDFTPGSEHFPVIPPASPFR